MFCLGIQLYVTLLHKQSACAGFDVDCEYLVEIENILDFVRTVSFTYAYTII